MRILFLIGMFFLVGCKKKLDPPKKTLNPEQVAFINQLSEDKKQYFKACDSADTMFEQSPDYRFTRCFEKMNTAFGVSAPKQKSGGSNVLGTAVGTAVGIGAAKAVFGK